MNLKRLKEYYDGPEYLKKLQSRADNLRMMALDPMGRSRMMLDIYAVDFERFCEDFLFLQIPEFGDATKPFFLFDYQRNIIRKLQEAEFTNLDVDLLVDKPRGMGLTWLVAGYVYWRWLFTPAWSCFLLSRTEIEVDDGTDIPNNSIMGKIRWLIKHTPPFLLPEGYQPKGKKGTSTDSTLRIINPSLGSAIVGSSTNSNAGRGRRYSLVLIDECFAIDRFNEVYRALQAVSRVRIFISTTKAGVKYKKFKELCEQAGWYVSLSWRDHPFKDQEWYDDQLRKAEYDPEILKEVDVSYDISPKLQYYPEIVNSSVVRIEYNPNLPLYCGLDFGKGDLTVIVWAQFSGNQLNIIECYSNSNKGKAEWYAPFLNPEHPIDGSSFVYTAQAISFMSRVRSWKKPQAYFGEVAHTIKSMADNRSIADVMARCGIRLIVNTYAIEHEPRRKATGLLLPRMVFNEGSEGVMDLYDAVRNSRYKTTTSSKDASMAPAHDEGIADFRAALEKLCVNIGRVFKAQRNDIGEKMKAGGFVNNLIQYLRV
jgi:hypothetical protein